MDDTADRDTVGSNGSTGSCLSNFDERLCSSNSNWTIWARLGFPIVSIVSWLALLLLVSFFLLLLLLLSLLLLLLLVVVVPCKQLQMSSGTLAAVQITHLFLSKLRNPCSSAVKGTPGPKPLWREPQVLRVLLHVFLSGCPIIFYILLLLSHDYLCIVIYIYIYIHIYVYMYTTSDVLRDPGGRVPRLAGREQRELPDCFFVREFRTRWWVPTWPKPENCRLLALNHFQDHLIATSSHNASVSWAPWLLLFKVI